MEAYEEHDLEDIANCLKCSQLGREHGMFCNDEDLNEFRPQIIDGGLTIEEEYDKCMEASYPQCKNCQKNFPINELNGANWCDTCHWKNSPKIDNSCNSCQGKLVKEIINNKPNPYYLIVEMEGDEDVITRKYFCLDCWNREEKNYRSLKWMASKPINISRHFSINETSDYRWKENESKWIIVDENNQFVENGEADSDIKNVSDDEADIVVNYIYSEGTRVPQDTVVISSGWRETFGSPASRRSSTQTTTSTLSSGTKQIFELRIANLENENNTLKARLDYLENLIRASMVAQIEIPT